MKRYSTLFVIKEMESKITMGYNYISIYTTNYIKKIGTVNSKHDENTEQWALLYLVDKLHNHCLAFST